MVVLRVGKSVLWGDLSLFCQVLFWSLLYVWLHALPILVGRCVACFPGAFAFGYTMRFIDLSVGNRHNIMLSDEFRSLIP